MTSLDQAWRSVADVDGWMTHDQASALFTAAAACPLGGRIVEIGSFRGRSTIVLASGATPGTTVIAIDPHAGNDRGPQEIDGYQDAAQTDHELFLGNLVMAGVADRVTHLRMFSEPALYEVSGSVDVLYVDGAHRYQPARADIRDWGARVSDGGTMLIHDSFSSLGVTLAIVRELLLGRRFRYVGRAGSLTVFCADLDGGRVSNALRQAAQLPWFVKNLGLKVLLTMGFGRLLKRVGRPVPEWPY